MGFLEEVMSTRDSQTEYTMHPQRIQSAVTLTESWVFQAFPGIT